jgi:hydrogenase-4 component F
MITAYIILSFLLVMMILIFRSHRFMSAVSALNFLAALIVAVSYLNDPLLPGAFVKGFFYVDHLALYEVIIAALVFFAAALYAGGYIERLVGKGEVKRGNLKLFYFSLNLLFFMTVLAFISNNIALFWIFLELTTFLSAVLIVIPNAKENIIAALNYILVTSTSMLFSLIGIILLFALSKHALGPGSLNWSTLTENAHLLPGSMIIMPLIFMFIGFGAKAGIVPFHTWLPHAHSKAPSVVSALLSGVLLNVGLYGMLRMFALARSSSSAGALSAIFIVFGLISIGVAALTMFSKKNIKKLIAFSSVENAGFMLLGMGIGTQAAIFWTLFHTLAHSISKALMFFSAGMIHNQYDSVNISDTKNVLKSQPLAATGLLVGGLSVMGAPFLPIFMSKLMILIQFARISKSLMVLLAVLFMLAASAFAYVVVAMLTNVSQDQAIKDRIRPTFLMRVSVIFLIAILLLLGIRFPDSLKDLLNTITAELRI